MSGLNSRASFAVLKRTELSASWLPDLSQRGWGRLLCGTISGVINKLLYEHAASLPAQALLVAQSVKISARDVGDLGSIPGLGRFPWRREWLLTLFMPGESHGQRSLVGYSWTRPSDPYFILPLAPNSMLAGWHAQGVAGGCRGIGCSAHGTPCLGFGPGWIPDPPGPGWVLLSWPGDLAGVSGMEILCREKMVFLSGVWPSSTYTGWRQSGGPSGRLQRPTGILGLDAFPGQESFGSSILDELIQSTLKPDQPATQDAQNTSCSSPPPLTAQGSFTGEFKGNSG